MEETLTATAEEIVTEEPVTPVTNEEPAPSPVEEPAPDYEALEREDLAALRAEFPELASVNTLSSLDDPTRYGELRDLGLSPREAYLATAKRQIPKADNRAHLQSAMPRAVSGGSGGISPRELEEARSLFSDLSDAEIRRLYQKVKA